ncbi:MAG: CDP-alcohol phosphatidyltransferase family protein, partial [Leuconostoc mesenteroides]
MNLPNKLTVFRIILIPVFILLLTVPYAWSENSVFVADIFEAHFTLTNTHDLDQKTEKSNFDTKIN